MPATPSEGQGRLDTQMSGWVSDAPKADGVPQGFDTRCEGDILRVYRLVTFFKVVQDAFQGAALMAAVVAVIFPPAATWAVLASTVAANLAGIIGTLELFIATTLPDIAAVSLELPELVMRADEVHVTGTVTFVYDPAQKRAEVINWAVNSMVGKAIGDVFGALGGTVPIDQQGLLTLSQRSVERTHDLANHLAQRATDEAGGPPPPGFTLPADPLLLDFRAARFELVPSHLPGECAAVGRWKDDQPCEVADTWTLGRNLAPTGWYAGVFSSNFGGGQIRSSDSPLLAEPYDSASYGEWLEAFARRFGCAAMEQCWADYGDIGCGPSALGSDAHCTNMFLGTCPSEADYERALFVCQFCY